MAGGVDKQKSKKRKVGDEEAGAVTVDKKKKEKKPKPEASDAEDAPSPPEAKKEKKSKKSKSKEEAQDVGVKASKKEKKAKKTEAAEQDGPVAESAEEPRESKKKRKKAEKSKQDEAADSGGDDDHGGDDHQHHDIPADGSRSVYISGLPFDYKRKDIEGIFEKVGAMVTYIHMPVFEDSKRCRGFATVTFTKSEYVPLALELDGSKLKGGRWLKVAPLDKSKLKKKSKGGKVKGADAKEKGVRGDEEATKTSGRKRRYTERPEGCNKVFVANIPQDAKETEVRDLFSRCGTITNLTMGHDKRTGRFSGSAWVEFEPNPDDEPAEKAFSISGKVRIHANKLFIDYAPDATVCYRCKSKEHLSRDCPRRQVHQNKRLRLEE